MKHPCKTCPFRCDTKIDLSLSTVERIEAEQIHVCHTSGNKKQCAGHMIYKGNESQFVTVAKRLFNMDILSEIKGHELVFKSKEKLLKHYENNKY